MDKDFNEVIMGLKQWENINAVNDQIQGNFNVDFIKEENGLIIISAGNEERQYKLKPLNMLYNESIKNDSMEHIMPLLNAIESSINNFDKNQEKLTDSRVEGILEK